MVNATHTPGPWEIRCKLANPRTRRIEQLLIVALGSNGNNIATVHLHCKRTRKETMANARLLRSAPRLLQALKAVLGYLETHQPNDSLRDEVWEAIELAESDKYP